MKTLLPGSSPGSRRDRRLGPRYCSSCQIARCLSFTEPGTSVSAVVLIAQVEPTGLVRRGDAGHGEGEQLVLHGSRTRAAGMGGVVPVGDASLRADAHLAGVVGRGRNWLRTSVIVTLILTSAWSPLFGSMGSSPTARRVARTGRSWPLRRWSQGAHRECERPAAAGCRRASRAGGRGCGFGAVRGRRRRARETRIGEAACGRG